MRSFKQTALEVTETKKISKKGSGSSITGIPIYSFSQIFTDF